MIQKLIKITDDIGYTVNIPETTSNSPISNADKIIMILASERDQLEIELKKAKSDLVFFNREWQPILQKYEEVCDEIDILDNKLFACKQELE